MAMLAAVALAFLPTGAVAARSADSADCHGPARGLLLSTIVLERLGRDQVAATLRESGIADSASYGVARYRLVYCTISPSGGATVASGVLALPQGVPGRLPLVIYAHGTVATRTDAPSFSDGIDGRLIPMIFSAEGLAVVAPDYLGLGVSPLPHPYLHAATEASATIDLLAAARVAAARLHEPLSGDVFVTGHSQGGHATMAIGQRLSATGGRWHLLALAPMAGPYDMSGIALPAALDPERTDPAKATLYLAYLLVSWKSLYALYTDPHDVFMEPYAATVEGLFDGEHEFDEIVSALPASPELLLRPEILALLNHPTGRLAAALRANDVCRWAPAVPTRLYAGRRDHDVVPEHAQRCRAQIAARGGVAEVVDAGEVDHIGTAIVSLPLIRDWFIHLRPGR